MPARPRPLVAVRLIGPAATVKAHAAAIAALLTAYYGDRATRRVSTHAAGYTGETRAYITFNRKENAQ